MSKLRSHLPSIALTASALAALVVPAQAQQRPGCACDANTLKVEPSLIDVKLNSAFSIHVAGNHIAHGQSAQDVGGIIDWGDGTTTSLPDVYGDFGHTYTLAGGDYQVSVKVWATIIDTGSANCSYKCVAGPFSAKAIVRP